MFCYFCLKSKKTNPFASAEGCINFRTSTLQRHKDCKEHEDAVNEEAMRDMFSNTQRRITSHSHSNESGLLAGQGGYGNSQVRLTAPFSG